MKKLNAEWHRNNKMPTNPTLEQKLEWHLAHTKYCACRPMPQSLVDEMKKREGLDKK
ncbi:hypothetical protein [Cellvibrio sp. PSBB023]|jgi:hypothetical protein|uniref:hypothetical protein n=1 Tax=Cellvibrio sp. PSBB023 TaxID=1945512 RepID=UPI00143A8617|nr:hypothetical protein [Cellvibrio sp. PSBB023]